MESHNRYVLLSYTLLRFDEACGLVNANDEISCNLGIEGTTVTCFFNVEHALNPCDDFVGGGVGGFVEVYNTGGDITLDVSHVRLAAMGDGCEMSRPDEQLVVVLQQQWPVAGVGSGCCALRLDDMFVLLRLDQLLSGHPVS